MKQFIRLRFVVRQASTAEEGAALPKIDAQSKDLD
jgi:hypothetical protein